MTFYELQEALIKQETIWSGECQRADTLKSNCISKQTYDTFIDIRCSLDEFANIAGEFNGVKLLKEKLEQMKIENNLHKYISTGTNPNSFKQWELDGKLYAINFALDLVNRNLLDAKERE